MDRFLKTAAGRPLGKESDVKRYVAGFAIFSSLIAVRARADSPVSSGGTAGTVEAKKEEPVRFYGLTFDFTLADSSGLNSIGHNYRNDLNFYFEPTWHVGAKYL